MKPHSVSQIVPLTVTSPAFQQGGLIPTLYTAHGANISPPLSWSALPPDTKSVVVLCLDPDAPSGTWVHWVLFNWPETQSRLPEHIPHDRQLPNGAKQGSNDFHRIGYGGPKPPTGCRHRYCFQVYALDTCLNLVAGVPKAQLEKALHGHILAQGELMGVFQAF